MRRRDFIALMGVGTAGALLGPCPAIATGAEGPPTIAVLMDIAEGSPEGGTRSGAFRRGLMELGWTDGKNIHLEFRWSAGQIALIRQFAEEFVALRSTVIVANGTPAVAAMKKATGSIPVVCAMVQDPVGLGLVKSLAHPGGNITGFTFTDPDLIGKWVDLLKQAAPGIARVGLIFNRKTTPFFDNFLREVAASRQSPAIDVIGLPASSTEEVDAAINTLARQPGSGLIVPPDPFNVDHIKQVAALARQNHLPAISVYRQFALENGLMAYGPDTVDIFRRAAGYVDRILKGAKAADLPVQEPTKFQFVLNLKTAKALGLTVPSSLVTIADEVIE